MTSKPVKEFSLKPTWEIENLFFPTPMEQNKIDRLREELMEREELMGEQHKKAQHEKAMYKSSRKNKKNNAH